MCFWKAADPPIWKYRRALHQLYLPVFAAFVCLLVSSGWTYPTGVALRDAAAVLLLVTVGLTFPICFSALSLAQFHDERTDPLILQVVIVLPLLLMGTIYDTIQFSVSVHRYQKPNTWVYFALFMIPTYISYAILAVSWVWVKRPVPPVAKDRADTDSNSQTQSGNQTQQG